MKRKFITGGTLCVLLIAFDRITKVWAQNVLRFASGAQGGIPRLFSFQYTENTGAAFGMLAGFRLLNALLTLALLIALSVFLWQKRREKGFILSGSIVMAGGLSHLYDRLLGQNIVDFIKLEFIRFPIFNVADICICAGTVLLAAAYIIYDNKTRSKNA